MIDKVFIGSGIALVLIVLFALFMIVGSIKTFNAPCSELSNVTIQNLPARCYTTYGVNK
jgi:hypothetical protein